MKPEGAISWINTDLTQLSLEDAFHRLTNESPIRGHYILLVSPSELLGAKRIVDKVGWPSLILDTHDWQYVDEWSLTVYTFDGESFTHKTYWSEGA